MRIKAIVFDLDDTLFDCTGQLVEAARWRAAKAMVAAGLPLPPEKAYELQTELARDPKTRLTVFQKIAEDFRLGDQLVEAAQRAYNSDEVQNIVPFPDVKPTLASLRWKGYKIFIVTTGVHSRQQKKVELLGLRPYADEVLICDSDLGLGKREYYETLLSRWGLKPNEVMSVGDRPYSEIRICNELGMVTVQILHGPYASWEPKSPLEVPDYRIRRIAELPDVILRSDRLNKTEEGRVVAIGGGTGLPIVLEGLKARGFHLTAVVTATDAGRSTGVLRKELQVPPPGDIRNCLVALSDSEKLLHDLLQYRFDDGSLRGMSFGNLFLSALTKITGSFEQAIKEAARILAVNGKVLPSTLQNVKLCAELADGRTVVSETEVRKLGKPPIRRLFLQPPDAEALQEAVIEIERADLIVLGPGSLYTSVISNLLVEGIRKAIVESKAKKVYVVNIVTQPGQTDGFSASNHISEIIAYLGKNVLDAVIINNGRPNDEVIARYKAEGAQLVLPDEGLSNFSTRIILDNLIERSPARVLWEKADLVRHDPDRLASLLAELL